MEKVHRGRHSVIRRCAVTLVTVLGLLIVLLLLDSGLRQFSTSSLACGATLRTDQGAVVSCGAHSSETVTIYVPGVVAGSPEAGPLTDTWLRFGDVQFIDYEGDRFEPEPLAQEFGRILEADLAAYDRVNIYAESMGCYLTLDALRGIKSSMTPKNRGKIQLVLGDCPSGAESITPFSAVVTFFYPGPIYNKLADGVFGLAHAAGIGGCPFAGKWSWSATCTPASQMSPSLDAASVQRKQVEASSGFPLSVFADQVRYLRQGIPDVGGVSGIETTYLMNQPAHDSLVTQPLAANAWKSTFQKAGISLTVTELDFLTDHCDYSAWPQEWNALFVSIFF